MALFRGVVDRLKRGLTKTREGLAASIRSIVHGRTLDEALIKEIEKRLIQSDVGVKATGELIGSIRRDAKAGKLTRGEHVIEHLKRELKAMWPERDRALNMAPTAPTVVLKIGRAHV